MMKLIVPRQNQPLHEGDGRQKKNTKQTNKKKKKNDGVTFA